MISTSSLVEHGESSSAEVAAALRECIDDLRLTIDSLEPTENAVPSCYWAGKTVRTISAGGPHVGSLASKAVNQVLAVSRATVASINFRAMLTGTGNRGSASMENHCASAISSSHGRISPPAYSAV